MLWNMIHGTIIYVIHGNIIYISFKVANGVKPGNPLVLYKSRCSAYSATSEMVWYGITPDGAALTQKLIMGNYINFWSII